MSVWINKETFVLAIGHRENLYIQPVEDLWLEIINILDAEKFKWIYVGEFD